MRLTTLLLATTLVAMSSPALAGPISSLYVLGDSLSDNGNLTAAVAASIPGLIVPAPPYAPGRASNGPVAAEYLAVQLGVGPLVPAALGGTNYAVIGAATGEVAIPGGGGATADNYAEVLLNSPLPFNTALLYQVAGFLFQNPGPIDPDALFLIWGGPNDLFINPSAPTALQAADNVATAVDALYARGARRFLVPNMPDLGLAPGADAGAVALTQLTLAFNGRLAGNLAIRGALPAVQLTSFDTFGLFRQLAGNPGAFGFTNVTDACVLGNVLGAQRSPLCALDDEAGFLFWDDTHPTTPAHRILGGAFAEAIAQDSVPEPLSMTLAGLGLAAVVLRRRRAA